MKLPKKRHLGFTLIELLVVISVIGILATLVLANLNAARARARDAQRKSDLRNIQTALRLYYNDRGSYPCNSAPLEIRACGSQAVCDSVTVCAWNAEWSVGTTIYMPTLPEDPLPGQAYSYTRTDTDTYTLQSCLENQSDPDGQANAGCNSGWGYQVGQ